MTFIFSVHQLLPVTFLDEPVCQLTGVSDVCFLGIWLVTVPIRQNKNLAHVAPGMATSKRDVPRVRFVPSGSCIWPVPQPTFACALCCSLDLPATCVTPQMVRAAFLLLKRDLCLFVTGFCFRCNGFGHVLADCYEDEAPKHGRVCVRCGKQECSVSGGMDWFRVHRGCREQYSQSDLRHVRCFVCGQQGHFCCEDTPLVRPAAYLSCVACYPICCSMYKLCLP